MFCTKCGSQIAPGSKFCTVCGNPVSADAPGKTLIINEPYTVQEESHETVPEENPDTVYMPPEIEPEKPPRSPKKKLSGGKIAAIVIILMLIVIIGLSVTGFILIETGSKKVVYLLNEGEYNEAIKLYKEKVRSIGFLDKLCKNMLKVQFDAKSEDFADGEMEYDDAIKYFSAILKMKALDKDEITEKLIDAIYARCNALQEENMSDEAREEYDALIKFGEDKLDGFDRSCMAEPKPVEPKPPESTPEPRQQTEEPPTPTIAPTPEITAAPAPSPAPSSAPVVFRDANFEAAFRSKYHVFGTITPETLLNYTELDLSECALTDISDVAMFENLQVLTLRKNEISDIEPISALTELTSLDLFTNKISDINPLFMLTKLTTLNLGVNEITDIWILSRFTDLIWLNLNYNQITDIGFLAGLTKLEHLNLHDNKITHIGALAQLTSLTWLNLNKCSLTTYTDVSPLYNLILLEELYIKKGNSLTQSQINAIQSHLPNTVIQ